jgi:Fur family ferric uptake transcriptional regulator
MEEQPRFRMTSQRQVILEYLQEHKDHPTADEVFRMVRRDLPRISLATVYRNLETLAEAGLIRRYGGYGQRRYEGNADRHYHVRCLGCGRLEDAPLERIASLEQDARKHSRFLITGHHIEFEGLCPDCQASGSAASERSRRRAGL